MPGIDTFTKLCAHLDGTDGSTTFTDSSAGTHTIAPVGTAQIDTAQSKFGGASGLFDGSSSALSVPGSADWAYGSGDFVKDWWARHAAIPAFSFYAQFAHDGNHIIYLGGDGTLRYFIVGVGDVITGTTVVSTGVWYHIAFVVSSQAARLFLNGVQEGSSFDVSPYAAAYDSSALALGGAVDGSLSVDGWMDEIRISKGTDRGWFGGFTPPTAAYSAAVPRSQAAIMG